MPSGLLSVGDELIAEGFLPIPNPPLPAHIQEGFTLNGIDIPEMKPADLRTQLKVQDDVDTIIVAAPWACLRKRSHVEHILRFCLSDSPEDNEVCGLPLIIDSRGYLRTLGETELPLYVAEYPWDLEVFGDHPDWFVEQKFADELGLGEMSGAGLLEMDSECFVQELSKYVSDQAIDGKITMSAANSGPFTDNWLQAVFNRLLNSDLDESVVREISLIPDKSRVLQPMGYTSTPLLCTIKNDGFRRALTKFSVPLVTGVSKALFNLLLEFSENKGYLWKVTPRDLIDTLEAESSEMLQQLEHYTDDHQEILKYLCKDDSITSLKKLPDQCESLKKLKLFPTVYGAVVNLDKQVYIPQDFTFPSVDFNVIMLEDGPSHKWRELYILLGVEELTRYGLIRDMLLPKFIDLAIWDQAKASVWLRNNLQIAINENGDVESGELM